MCHQVLPDMRPPGALIVDAFVGDIGRQLLQLVIATASTAQRAVPTCLYASASQHSTQQHSTAQVAHVHCLTSMKGLMVKRELSVVPVMGRLKRFPSSSRKTTLAVMLMDLVLAKLTMTGSFSLAMPINSPSGNSNVRGRCVSSGGGWTYMTPP